MTRPDPLTLLSRADPAARLGAEVDLGDPPPSEVLEQITARPRDAAPGGGRGHGRRPARRIAIGACAATVAVAVVIASPLAPSTVDVVAEAQEATSGEDVILHYTAQWRSDDTAEVLTEAEVWEDFDSFRTRELPAGPGAAGAPVGAEMVRDRDGLAVYVPSSDELHIAPTGGDRPLPLRGAPITLRGIGSLSTLLDRARAGEIEAAEIGETTVRGVQVHELRLGPEPVACGGRSTTWDSDLFILARGPGPASGVRLYVATDDHRPVRVEVRYCVGTDASVQVVDYLHFERLARTPENEQLLEMSPHPGAERRVEGAGVTRP